MLGGFDLVSSHGDAIKLPTRKSSLLLAYLAAPMGQSHSREKLAGLFWGDTQTEQARGSLRHALGALRSALGPQCIDAGHETVTLLPGHIDCDTDRLARSAGKGADAAGLDLDTIYRGEFLAGHSHSNQEFTDWLVFERTRCRNLAETVFERAIGALEAGGWITEAIAMGHRLVALDPLREQSHRILMRMFEAAGERSKALEQYQRLKDLLAKELAVEPSAQSAALARLILAAQPDGTAAPVSAPAAEPDARAAAAPGAAGIAVPGPISIVVLPFASLSEGTDDQLVARGFSEDLITELSRMPELFVIARQSSDQFPAASATASLTAGDLGVRYAVAGTFRRSGDYLRITAQLADAVNNRCLWAERYDGPVRDAFAIQDDIIASIASTLDAQIRLAERERAARLDGETFGAWELAHRGLWHLHRFTKAETEVAEAWFARAIALSPQFAVPYAGLAYAAFVRALWNFSDDLEAVVTAGLGHGRRAVELDPKNAFAHAAFGRMLMLSGKLQDAFDYMRRAIDLNPSFAGGHFALAQALLWAGQPGHALPRLELAERLSPKDPLLYGFLNWTAFCHFTLGDFAAAEATARRSIQLQPNDRWSRLGLAAALVGAGRLDEARDAVAAARALEPGLSTRSLELFLRHAAKESRDGVMAALQAAGL
jgi:TolB-like protein/Tfp pilus assembly protein PilF